MLLELNKQELLLIEGGHDGEAYNAGKNFGIGLKKTAVLIGILAFFIR